MKPRNEDFDFTGWALTTGTVCTDGLVMAENAFQHMDGKTVPLVWEHTSHKTPKSILGTALLKNVKGGLRAYCNFNHTDDAQHCKEVVKHGDITRLSAWGTQCERVGNKIINGLVKEVSLVLNGADPKATIDTECFAHSDAFIETEYGEFDEDAIIYLGSIDFVHADSDKKEEDKKEKSEEKKDDDETIDVTEEFKRILSGLNETDQNIVLAVIGAAANPEAASGNKDDVKHSDEEGEGFIHGDYDNYEMEEDEMHRNVFDSNASEPTFEFTHADQQKVIQMAVEGSRSLKETVKEYLRDNAEFQHADGDPEYGIGHVEWLFPDYKNVDTTPDFIKRPTDWVSIVMNGVHHVPMTRIRSMHADITGDDARALGYIKGDEKEFEFFDLIRRTTDPQTIYKLQQLDRDDIIDITDFDVVAWLKLEMRMMLDEEIARAILVGDGRPSSSRQKIQQAHVRAISEDEDLYSIKHLVTVGADASEDEKSRAYIRGIIKSFKNYRGKGSPVMFIREDVLTDMRLVEDKNGRMIYETLDKLKAVLRVTEIYTVPVMDNTTYSVKENDDHDILGSTGSQYDVIALILNLDDYYVGADKGGSVSMFDDFDIRFNQYQYLIETRISGALVHPKSAITILSSVEESSSDTTPTTDDDENAQG